MYTIIKRSAKKNVHVYFDMTHIWFIQGISYILHTFDHDNVNFLLYFPHSAAWFKVAPFYLGDPFNILASVRSPWLILEMFSFL